LALGSKLQVANLGSLASVAFYGIVGIIFLVLLAVSGFPPHIGLMGITSLITAYGLLKKRNWAIWMVAALFFVATAFSLYTLYYVLSTDALASAGMIAYAVLTWIFTGYALKKRNADKV
jgi:SNF family Na+-dependent transporter